MDKKFRNKSGNIVTLNDFQQKSFAKLIGTDFIEITEQEVKVIYKGEIQAFEDEINDAIKDIEPEVITDLIQAEETIITPVIEKKKQIKNKPKKK